MSLDKLESTNRLLHDLERKLSISSSASSTHTNQSHNSHGSVVQDPSYHGVARQNIQSSVLNYIKNNGSSFDAERVYANRQQKFTATSFGREYSPSSASPHTFEVALNPEADIGANDGEAERTGHVGEVCAAKTAFASSLDQEVQPLSPSGRVSPKASPKVPVRSQMAQNVEKTRSKDVGYDGSLFEGELNGSCQNKASERRAEALEDEDYTHYDHYYDSDYNDSFTQDLSNADLEASPTSENFSDDELGLEADMLLPPSPPRMPPRELDPDKLYGIYDFSGPDPSHCTLSRDEPVYLRNDSDNYWWLIQKLSKKERLSLWNARGSEEDLFEDDEHGKIGFVPAECLETYEERLARLNCFRNENLDQELSEAEEERPASPEPPSIGRIGSILKKSRAFRLNNKSVTFENLENSCILDNESEDDEVDFSDHYYSMSHEDIEKSALAVPDADEKHSEVLSDVFPSEIPLQVSKKSRKKKDFVLQPNGSSQVDPGSPNMQFIQPNSQFIQPNSHFIQPNANFSDQASIGSFSPDTPQQDHPKQFSDAGQVRRSFIIDRLQLVTSELGDASDATFGGALGDESDPEAMIPDTQSVKTQSMEEVTTPRASLLNQPEMVNPEIKVSNENDHAPPREKKRAKPMHDMFQPLLGKLDELTEKLAEFEQSL